MEETFETRDRKRPLKVYVTPTERQASERQAPVHREWQLVDASATLKGKCPCRPRFASLSGVVRMPLPVIRSLCAWGLVLSLSAISPLAVLSDDTPSEGGESPVLHSTITQTERIRPQSPTVNTGDVRMVDPARSWIWFFRPRLPPERPWKAMSSSAKSSRTCWWMAWW